MATTFQFGEAVVIIKGDMRELAAALGQSRGLVDDFAKETEKSADTAVDSFKDVDVAVAGLNALLMVAAQRAGQLADTWMHAAGRLETLEISLQNVGKMAGYSEDELLKHRDAIKAAGIETKGATQATIAFITSQLDVSKASKVARVAQDLAVIAGTDSTAMFNRLTQAISMQRPILLRAAGITTGLTEIYAKFSEETGVAVKAMDAQQKKTAMLNFILAYGERAFGTYKSAMGSAYKQMGSMTRYAEEMKNAFGEHLQPVFMAQVSAQKAFYKTMVDLHPVLQGTIALTMKFGSVAVGAAAGLKTLSVMIPIVTGGTLTLTGALGLLATTILPVIAVVGLLAGAYSLITNQLKKAKEADEANRSQIERTEAHIVTVTKSYEEYTKQLAEMAIESGLVPHMADETATALALVDAGLIKSHAEWVAYTEGLNKVAVVTEEVIDDMLNMGKVIEMEAEAKTKAVKMSAAAAREEDEAFFKGSSERAKAYKKRIEQMKEWADAINEVFTSALDSTAEYEEGRVALVEEANQSVADMTAQFEETQTLTQARHYQALAQLEAQWQADRSAATAAGDIEEVQKLDAAYQQELAKRQANWSNKMAMDQQENALALARLDVSNAQQAHANAVARLNEITALKKHAAEEMAIKYIASNAFQKLSAASQTRYMQFMDNAFGLRLQKDAEFAAKSLDIAARRARGEISIQQALAETMVAIEKASDKELIEAEARAAQKAIDDAQAALAALVDTYGIAATVIPDYVQATTAAGDATRETAKATETAVEALEDVISSLRGVATEAIELVTEVLGFEAPEGLGTAFENIANAMVMAVTIVYDAWQAAEGKARKAGEFSEHVRKIFAGMQAALDFMRQAERPARMLAETAKRVVAFIKESAREIASIVEGDEITPGYDEELLTKMHQFSQVVGGIMQAMGVAFALTQEIRGRRISGEVPTGLFSFIGSLMTGLGELADTMSPTDLAKLARWAAVFSGILDPIKEALDVIKELDEYPDVSQLGVNADRLVRDIDRVVWQMTDTLKRLVDAADPANADIWELVDKMERQAEWIHAWAIGVHALVAVLGPAIDSISKLAEYKSPRNLGQKAVQLVSDLGAVIQGVVMGIAQSIRWPGISTPDAIRDLMQDRADWINAWIIGIEPLGKAVKLAIGAVEAFAEYETPEGLAAKAQQVVYDVGSVFGAVMEALVGGFFPLGRRGRLTPEDYREMFAESVEMFNVLNEILTPLSSAIKNMVETVNALSTYTRVQNIEEKVARLVYDMGVVIGEFGQALEDGLGLAEDAAINATKFAEQMEDIVSIVTDGLDAIAALQDYTSAGAGFELRVQAFIDDLVRIMDVFAGADGLPAFPADLLPIVEAFATGFGDVASIVKDGLDVIAGLRDYVKTGSDFMTRTVYFIEDVWTVVEMFRDNLAEFPAELVDRAEQFKTGFEHMADIIKMGLDAIEGLTGYIADRDLDKKTEAFLSALLGSATGELIGIVPLFNTYLHEFEVIAPGLTDRARRFRSSFQEIEGIIKSGLDAIEALSAYIPDRDLDNKVEAFLSALVGSETGEEKGIVPMFYDGLWEFERIAPGLVDRASLFNANFQEIHSLITMGLDAIAMLLIIPTDLDLSSKIDTFIAFIQELGLAFADLWGFGDDIIEPSRDFKTETRMGMSDIGEAFEMIGSIADIASRESQKFAVAMMDADNTIDNALQDLMDTDYTYVGRHIPDDIAEGIRAATEDTLIPILPEVKDALTYTANSILWQDYTRIGRHMVEDMAEGITDGIADSLIPALDRLSQFLVLGSPAKRGPLSQPLDWEGYLTEGLDDALRKVRLAGPGMSSIGAQPAGTVINMPVQVIGGVQEYQTAQRLITAAEQVAAMKGDRLVRAGRRR